MEGGNSSSQIHSPTHSYPLSLASLCKSEAGCGPGQHSKLWGTHQGGTHLQQAEQDLVKE